MNPNTDSLIETYSNCIAEELMDLSTREQSLFLLATFTSVAGSMPDDVWKALEAELKKPSPPGVPSPEGARELVDSFIETFDLARKVWAKRFPEGVIHRGTPTEKNKFSRN